MCLTARRKRSPSILHGFGSRIIPGDKTTRTNFRNKRSEKPIDVCRSPDSTLISRAQPQISTPCWRMESAASAPAPRRCDCLRFPAGLTGFAPAPPVCPTLSHGKGRGAAAEIDLADQRYQAKRYIGRAVSTTPRCQRRASDSRPCSRATVRKASVAAPTGAPRRHATPISNGGGASARGTATSC